MTDIHEFRRRRADKAEDNKLVTPEDMLLEALDALRSGRKPFTSVLILYRIPNEEDTGFTHGHYAANLTRPDHLCLLKLAERRLIDDWIGVDD